MVEGGGPMVEGGGPMVEGGFLVVQHEGFKILHFIMFSLLKVSKVYQPVSPRNQAAKVLHEYVAPFLPVRIHRQHAQ